MPFVHCPPGRTAGLPTPGVLWALLLLLVLGGCGRSSFVGRQYDDFTAYYNKFHNAQTVFEDGVESIRESERSIDRTQYLSLFLEPTSNPGESFEKAIQKSADVLREHPNSKWVDDALLMIGRSYYYQQNYVGAAQKFREVIRLGGEGEGEARYWLARSLITNERYSDAADALAAGLGSDQRYGTWTARMQMARGELLARQEQWEGAEEALQKGLKGDLPDRLAARGAYLLGQVRQTLGNPDGARQAFREVLDHDPRYELAFAARLSSVELQGRHGDTEAALDRLRDLERDDKNYELRGQMALVRARILRDSGRPDEARRVLRSTLYGDETPSGQSRGRLQYELAALYRDAYEDFSTAAAHFDTASTDLGAPRQQGANTSVRRMPTAPLDAQTQADQFRGLAEQAQEVARLDSLLRLGRMSEQELQSFVADLRQRRREQLEAEQAAQAEAANRAAQSRQFGQAGQARAQERQASAPATQTRQSDAGFLFHNDPARVQEGRQQFRRIWGQRARVDNWRRRAAIRNSQTASAEGESGASTGGGDEAPRSQQSRVVQIDLSAVPRDSASLAEMEAERAVARYELGNALFLSAERPDSAATWYRRVLEQNSQHPVADRARYALAEVYRAQGETEKARRFYRQIIAEAPNSTLAARARQRLGRAPRQAEAGTQARADTAYAEAYAAWQEGRLDSALVNMLDLAHRYPATKAAPRALLASSVIYWRQMQRGGVPPSPDLLVRRLPALDSVHIADRSTDAAATDSSSTEAASVSSDTTSMQRPSAGAPVDSAAVDTTALRRGGTGTPTPAASAPDTSRQTRPPDTTRQPPARSDTARAAPSVGDTTRAVQGRWVLVVASLERDSAARRVAESYRQRLSTRDHPVRVCRADGRHRVGIGAFGSIEAARAAKDPLSTHLPPDAWPHECAGALPQDAVVADTGRSERVSPPSPRRRPQDAGTYEPLERMLTFLTTEYPEAPQAQRAQEILKIVQERRQAADSTAQSNRAQASERRSNPDTSTTAEGQRASNVESPQTENGRSAQAQPRRGQAVPSRPVPPSDSAATDTSTVAGPQPRAGDG